MKKLITTCAMLTAITMVSFAQGKSVKAGAPTSGTTRSSASPSPEQLAERQAKALQVRYGLTAEQYSGVYAAELGLQNDLKQAKDNGYEPGPGQSMQMKMTRDMRIKNAMTPDQYSRYEADQASAK